MKRRKFVVKPFAPAAALAPRTASGLWATLRTALDKIFRHEMAALSFAELCKAKLDRHCRGLQLHERFKMGEGRARAEIDGR